MHVRARSHACLHLLEEHHISMRIVRYCILPKATSRCVADQKPCMLAVANDVLNQCRVRAVRYHNPCTHISFYDVVLQGTCRFFLDPDAVPRPVADVITVKESIARPLEPNAGMRVIYNLVLLKHSFAVLMQHNPSSLAILDNVGVKDRAREICPTNTWRFQFFSQPVRQPSTGEVVGLCSRDLTACGISNHVKTQ